MTLSSKVQKVEQQIFERDIWFKKDIIYSLYEAP